jgi:hypothetical protein
MVAGVGGFFSVPMGSRSGPATPPSAPSISEIGLTRK